jgi:choline kinase
MKAIIAAAGRSSRLYPLTLTVPKPLLRINGLTIIEHSIENLYRHGVKDICVVTGYLGEQFPDILADRVTFISNPSYKCNNNMASLSMAEDFAKDSEFLYLHGDLVYHPDILEHCLESKNDITLMVDKRECDGEAMKVTSKDGLLVESSKEIPPERAHGEWTGIAGFSVKGGRLIFSEIRKILAESKDDVYDTYAFTSLAKSGCGIVVCDTSGLPWVEVDFEKDLKKAREIYRTIGEGGR